MIRKIVIHLTLSTVFVLGGNQAIADTAFCGSTYTVNGSRGSAFASFCVVNGTKIKNNTNGCNWDVSGGADEITARDDVSSGMGIKSVKNRGLNAALQIACGTSDINRFKKGYNYYCKHRGHTGAYTINNIGTCSKD